MGTIAVLVLLSARFASMSTAAQALAAQAATDVITQDGTWATVCADRLSADLNPELDTGPETRA